MTIQLNTSAVDLAAVEEFAAKVGGDRAAAYNAVLVYLGDRLGLWQALASVDSATSAQLAERSGLAERYVREWLSAQAAAGYLTYDPETTSFSLPAEHAMVLADEDSPFSVAGVYGIIAAVWASADQLAHAYVTGEGVAWHDHDPRLFTGVERFFRTQYRHQLVDAWLPTVDGLVDRLTAGIRVVDVGCGLGASTILMAEAFPASTFVGVDYHEESIRGAVAAAEAAGVSDRVRFETGDAQSYEGTYDLVCFFDALHDLGDPIGALEHAHSVLAEEGQVFTVEPFAEDTLEANLASPMGLTYFCASSCLCVPHSMSEDGLALGAQAGPTKLKAAFTQAGFTTARIASATPYNLVIEARA